MATPDGPSPVDPRQVAGWFDRGAEAYETVVWRNRQGAERLAAALPAGPYRRVLDVGCGTGFASTAVLRRHTVESLTGIDLAPAMLARFAHELGGVPGLDVRAHQSDVVDMPVEEGTIDLVVSSMAFHWFTDRSGALAAMARALAPGGVLAILTGCDGTEEEYRQTVLALDPPVPAALADVYANLVTLDEMERLLRDAGLAVIDVWLERRRRQSSVAEFVARTRMVAGHLIADLAPRRQEAIWRRVEGALSRSRPGEPFVYHFHKLYALARRPGSPGGSSGPGE